MPIEVLFAGAAAELVDCVVHFVCHMRPEESFS